jgi:hypothetical protein
LYRSYSLAYIYVVMRIGRNSLGIIVVYLKKFVYYIGINELNLLSFTCRKMLEIV